MKKIKSLKMQIIGGFSFVSLIVIILGTFACMRFVDEKDYVGAVFFGVATAVTAIIGILTEISVVKAIMEPTIEIEKAVSELEKGNANISVKKKSDNELGLIVDGLNRMIQNTKRQAEVARLLSKGDLTMDVVPISEVDELGIALASIVKDNNESLGNIREAAVQVAAGSSQVSDASQALAQGSTEQASAIQQITASMDEIAERTKTNATQATNADEIVNEIKNDTRKGNEQMQEMMGAMKLINESSANISKVIKVIDDIAFQTNILALNATVEAARAGVHGKGFAVVAEEVRNLAEKSASAASETSDMIQDSMRKVQVGSELAADTNKALDQMVEKIIKVATLIDNIAKASNDQAGAVTQINQAISQVSQVVQTNSSTSEQCAAASQELANQSEMLQEMIGNYKLKEKQYKTVSYSGKSVSGKTYGSQLERESNEQIISLDGGFGKY